MALIMIVDDDEAFREGLAETLNDLGHNVELASSGEEAIGKLESLKIELLFVDLRMPGMDGLEVLRRLRADELNNELPVIILTAYSGSKNTIEAMKLGAFDHLTKPVGREDVKDVLARALARPKGKIFSSERYDPALEEGLVGASAAMREVHKLIGIASGSDATANRFTLYIFRLVKRDLLFLIFFALLVILTLALRPKPSGYIKLVEWDTIAALTGLLILVTGIKESGYLHSSALKIIGKLKSERSLALTLVIISAFMSMFLTNDVALFIVVPLTLSLQELLTNDIKKIIVFEAIAVNAGSTLTPIGNPQNLFLWHESQTSFLMFVYEMMPLVLTLLGALLLFAVFCFSGSSLSPVAQSPRSGVDKKLFAFSIALFLIFLILFNFRLPEYGLIPVILIYLIFFRGVLRKVDWMLIALFILMFIDFRLAAEIPIVRELLSAAVAGMPQNLFILSALTSQAISNVPAAILLSEYSEDWLMIAYGVNIAGNGIFIGSLANIIALRFVEDKRVWLTFHLYSIPFFLVTAVVFYAILFGV